MWSDAIWETPSQTNIIIQLVVISHLRKHEHYHQNKTLSQYRPSNIWELETGNITNLLGLQSRKEYFMLEQIWKWLHNRMYWKSIFIPTKVWTNIFHFLSDKTNHEINISFLDPLSLWSRLISFQQIFYLIQNETVSLCCVLPAAQWACPACISGP